MHVCQYLCAGMYAQFICQSELYTKSRRPFSFRATSTRVGRIEYMIDAIFRDDFSTLTKWCPSF